MTRRLELFIISLILLCFKILSCLLLQLWPIAVIGLLSLWQDPRYSRKGGYMGFDLQWIGGL